MGPTAVVRLADDPASASFAPRGRVHALDGLRAVAISLVVVHHLGLGQLAVVLRRNDLWAWGAFAETVGTSGVELFFVLSGLVLGAPYLRGERTFHAGDYLRRRVVRLFPPY